MTAPWARAPARALGAALWARSGRCRWLSMERLGPATRASGQTGISDAGPSRTGAALGFELVILAIYVCILGLF